MPTLSPEEIKSIEKLELKNPHSLLGMHMVDQYQPLLVVRAVVLDCTQVDIVSVSDEKEVYRANKIGEYGLYEVNITGKPFFDYRIRVHLIGGGVKEYRDPYSFLPTLSEDDLYLHNEGTDQQSYKKVGAIIREIKGIRGVAFSVWAPNARRISVVGSFNNWDGRCHPMRLLGVSGFWELFIPEAKEGDLYKYEIEGENRKLFLKTDPYGAYFEGPPNNASIVHNCEDFSWKDHGWMTQRGKTDWHKEPISVYEVHLGSWKKKNSEGAAPFSYREIAQPLVDYVVDMGFTHVEFMPLTEYPFSGSWGYQVTGFFAPTHRFGNPQDFMYLVDTFHKHNIGVIIDWVPAHFPRDAFALAEFDGTALYEHQDPKQGAHQDWGTLIFNYGRHEVKNFLINSALCWCDRYHIDGLRVDAVASMLYLDYSRDEGEWIPNQYGGRENIEALEFLRETNDVLHECFPGVLTIAEESTSWGGVSKPTKDGGLGFDFKWNMGWMHDNLVYFSKDPIHRKWHHDQLTFGMIYQHSENFIQVFSHDEVVHGKGSMLRKMGGRDFAEKACSLRALYAWMWFWQGKKTLFMGSEFGQSNEWQYDQSLQWNLLQYPDHYGVQRVVRDLNRLYREDPDLGMTDHQCDAFEWVNREDAEHSVISFIRRCRGENNYLVVGNFTPVLRSSYRIGVPLLGFWKEILNTNAHFYGGSNLGNKGGLSAEDIGCDGKTYSILADLPPQSVSVFRY